MVAGHAVAGVGVVAIDAAAATAVHALAVILVIWRKNSAAQDIFRDVQANVKKSYQILNQWLYI